MVRKNPADRPRDVGGDRVVVFVQRRTAHKASLGDSIWFQFSTGRSVGHVRRCAPQQTLHSGFLSRPGPAFDAVHGPHELKPVADGNPPNAEKLTATSEMDIMGAAAHGQTPLITPKR